MSPTLSAPLSAGVWLCGGSRQPETRRFRQILLAQGMRMVGYDCTTGSEVVKVGAGGLRNSSYTSKDLSRAARGCGHLTTQPFTVGGNIERRSLGFEDGSCSVLVASEALTMGANFSIIKVGIQFGAPENLVTHVHRWGEEVEAKILAPRIHITRLRNLSNSPTDRQMDQLEVKVEASYDVDVVQDPLGDALGKDAEAANESDGSSSGKETQNAGREAHQRPSVKTKKPRKNPSKNSTTGSTLSASSGQVVSVPAEESKKQGHPPGSKNRPKGLPPLPLSN
ncbi:hypothetical protein BDV93DRAFT_513042 [Ceratobasidium sp. AG-I]|nr:hypothetical protein BDV93DRAFT_513042 [Ceratobasidium sp. AG-I]